MSYYLFPDDVTAFVDVAPAKLAAMISDVEAQAKMAAPCIADPAVILTSDQTAYVTSILRRAVLRWAETGAAGATTTESETAGPFGASSTTTIPFRCSASSRRDTANPSPFGTSSVIRARS